MRARYSSRAQKDYEDILLYSIDEWGAERAEQYGRDLIEALARLERFPFLGKPAWSIDEAVRVLAVNQHLMIYEILGDDLTVIRIVHVRSGPTLGLDR